MCHFRLLFLSCISLACFVYTNAQTLSKNELIAAWKISDTSQTRKAEETYTDLKKNISQEKINRLLPELEKAIDKSENSRLKIRLFIYQLLIQGNWHIQVPYQYDKQALLKVIHQANILNDEQLLSELYSLFANVKNSHKNIEEVALYYTKLIEIQEKIGVQHFPGMYKRYIFLSNILYNVGDYRQAISIGLRGLAVQKKSNINIIDRIPQFDFIAASYNRIGIKDSVLHYYQLAEEAFTKADWGDIVDTSYIEIWKSVIKGGIGRGYFLQENDAAALPLLQQFVATSIQYKQYNNAASGQNLLSAIAFKKNQYANALHGYKTAFNWALQEDNLTELANASKGIADIFNQKNQTDSTYHYLMLYNHYQDSLQNKMNRHLATMVKAQADYEVTLNAFRKAQNEVGKQKNIRNLLLGSIIVLVAIGFLLYNRYRLKQKVKREKLEKEKQLAEAEARNAKQQVEHAKELLHSFKQNISDKNRLIEELQEQINEDTKLSIHHTLRTFTILTDADWLAFKNNFEKVYPGFWQRLNQKLPGLTLSEQRYLALSKLALSHKEMAVAIGVSPQSLRVTIHRLRKKLDISETDSISLLAQSV